MSKSGLYAHFGSKQELQLATIQGAWDIFEAQVIHDPPGERGGGPGPLLERWLSFSEQKVFPGGCLFLHQAVEFSSRPGPVREALTRGVARQIHAIDQQVSATTQPRGRLRRDASEVAFELHSIVINADALFQIQHDPAVFDRARAAIRVLCPDPSKPANKGRASASK